MRRFIKSRGLYEIVFRARDSIPFPCTMYMKKIIESVLARVQRDAKVILHHYNFEGSHPHMLCTAQDAYQCQRFYGELQKQLTDSIKRLTGKTYLRLWEGRATVSQVSTLDDAINRIAYIYTNPSNDNLVDSIEQYPGVSSWSVFKEATELDACATTEHPWIRLPMIPKLPSRVLSMHQDRFFCEKMLEKVKIKHKLNVYLNSWIKIFIKDPTPEQVEVVYNRIISRIKEVEEENRKERVKSGKTVLGAARLRIQPLLKPHTPKKKGRKIFMQSMFKDIRIMLIQEMKMIDALCRKIYQLWKKGDFSMRWPPGTFPPPLPPQASQLAI
jgi:hypothetical protein